MASESFQSGGVQPGDRREYWKLAVALYQASGLTAAAFCRREGLNTKTFSRWKRLFADTASGRLPPAGGLEFVPVVVRPDLSVCGQGRSARQKGAGTIGAIHGQADPGMAGREVALQITLANGRLVRASVPAQAGMLLPILQAMEALS